ncbi:MAG: GNAT family N-acetyltransferase [Hyphomonadaceae bacterium]
MMEVKQGLVETPEVRALLGEHLEDMKAQSPPGSVHALDVSGLLAAEVTFLTAWQDDVLLGCGALKRLDQTHGELKSMRTATAHRRKGVAAILLEALIAVARDKGLTRLSLETGTPAAFDAARAFYAKHGFDPCAAFADYPADDPYSTFMTREI